STGRARPEKNKKGFEVGRRIHLSRPVSTLQPERPAFRRSRLPLEPVSQVDKDREAEAVQKGSRGVRRTRKDGHVSHAAAGREALRRHPAGRAGEKTPVLALLSRLRSEERR